MFAPSASAGPTVLENYQFLEKIAHFDRERIPERVVHARGAGAHGFFEPTGLVGDEPIALYAGPSLPDAGSADADLRPFFPRHPWQPFAGDAARPAGVRAQVLHRGRARCRVRRFRTKTSFGRRAIGRRGSAGDLSFRTPQRGRSLGDGQIGAANVLVSQRSSFRFATGPERPLPNLAEDRLCLVGPLAWHDEVGQEIRIGNDHARPALRLARSAASVRQALAPPDVIGGLVDWWIGGLVDWWIGGLGASA